MRYLIPKPPNQTPSYCLREVGSDTVFFEVGEFVSSTTGTRDGLSGVLQSAASPPFEVPAMSLQLTIIEGPDKGRVFTLHPGNDNLLGRGKDVLYQVTDPRTSRSHCQVVREGDQVTVICLGGSGGTF